MLIKVANYVNQFQMIQEQDKIVVGVSGGADSVCLVLVLLEIRKRIPLSLEIAHLHHGIRGEEADRDAAFVQSFCQEYGLPFHLKKISVPKIAKEQGMTEEEAGRFLRYEFFRELARTYKAQKIAVAHNKNDSAETMLFHLIRGTGLKGLAGIPPKNGNVIRPLLCMERKEIERFLKEREVSFCMDSTNLGEDYTRNKIRNKLFPYIMEEFNPEVVSALGRAGDNLRQAWNYIENQTDSLEEQYLKKVEKGWKISKEAFVNVPKVILAELVLRGFIRVTGSSQDFSEIHRESLYRLMEKESGKSVNLPYGVIGRNQYGALYLEKQEQRQPEAEIFLREIPLKDGRIYFNDHEYVEISIEKYEKGEIFLEKKYTKWFDYDIIKDTLQIRNRKDGDKISVTKDGGTKKIKDYFINEKIPRLMRDEILLLASGQEILWVIGYRISEDYKITEHTKKVLKVKYGGKSYGTEH